jgi:tRNA G18 (ribose-2'-O)-methylase SpoU
MFRFRERELASRPQKRDAAGDGMFIAEGDLVVERALDVGLVPVAAIVDARRPPEVAHRLVPVVTVYCAEDAVRSQITRNGVPSPVLAVFRRPPRPSVADLAAIGTHLVFAEGVDNPVNIGGIVRNAAALGWHGLVLDRSSADPLARRALRVSMGLALAFPFARADDTGEALATLVSAGFQIAALTPSPTAVDIDDVPPFERLVLLVGSERSGLSADALQAATVHVRIPMAPGADSLNAAAATAVACHVLRPPT